ncbi:MAG TPA: TadE/TadG family type IV pilus assembly protein [Gaiellaceae bacterium]
MKQLEAILRREGWGSESGTAVVEFAVVLPLLLLIVFGIVDFGRALNYTNNATHIASEGARWAVVDSNPGAPSQSLQRYLAGQADSSEMMDNATVCVSFPNGGAPQAGDPVEVTVAVSFNWTPYISNTVFGGSPTSTFTGKAVMRLERPPSSYGTGCYHV